jgi:phage repressor protein C with HTH and peptisase S24 domain
MMDVHERLRAAREKANYDNASDATEAFGWSYSTYAGHENGSRGFNAATAAKYAAAFRVSPEWLLFGDGKLERVENNEPSPADGSSLVPVYDVAASAGDGALVDYEGVAYSLAFPQDYLKRITSSSPKHLTIISVKGDSMEPTLSDDDIVMLDMSKTSLGYEGLFVIRIYDVLHVKRLSHSRPGYVLVISDNKNMYPQREYSTENVQVVGKVLWAGGKV